MNTKLTTFRLQRFLGRYPGVYFPLYKLFGRKKYLAVANDTEIVIEGFPRSANTFAVVAFKHAQERPIKIAHHLHVPAQIFRAAKLDIPTVVLLRDPVSAVASLAVREPHINLEAALQDYVDFHRLISPMQDHFVIARFETVISDFGKVILSINQRFGTSFSEFQHQNESVDYVFDNLESLEEDKQTGLTDESKVARPSNHRNELNDAIAEKLKSKKYAARLRQARDLYDSLSSGTKP